MPSPLLSQPPVNASRRIYISCQSKGNAFIPIFSCQRLGGETPLCCQTLRKNLSRVFFFNNNFDRLVELLLLFFFFPIQINWFNNQFPRKGEARLLLQLRLIWRNEGKSNNMRNLVTVIRFTGSETERFTRHRRAIARPCRCLYSLADISYPELFLVVSFFFSYKSIFNSIREILHDETDRCSRSRRQ